MLPVSSCKYRTIPTLLCKQPLFEPLVSLLLSLQNHLGFSSDSGLPQRVLHLLASFTCPLDSLTLPSPLPPFSGLHSTYPSHPIHSRSSRWHIIPKSPTALRCIRIHSISIRTGRSTQRVERILPSNLRPSRSQVRVPQSMLHIPRTTIRYLDTHLLQ